MADPREVTVDGVAETRPDGHQLEAQLTPGETTAAIVTTDVALPVGLGPPVPQLSSLLSVRPLQTPKPPAQAARGHAGSGGASRRVRSPSVQDLCFAAHRGDTASIEALLDQVRLDDRGKPVEDGVAAVDVNGTNARGLGALHWAVAGSQHAAVALLLERHADVNLKDRAAGSARAALHYATDCLMLELLLQAGADYDTQDAAGRTAAQHHAERKRKELSDFVRFAPSMSFCRTQRAGSCAPASSIGDATRVHLTTACAFVRACAHVCRSTIGLRTVAWLRAVDPRNGDVACCPQTPTPGPSEHYEVQNLQWLERAPCLRLPLSWH